MLLIQYLNLHGKAKKQKTIEQRESMKTVGCHCVVGSNPTPPHFFQAVLGFFWIKTLISAFKGEFTCVFY